MSLFARLLDALMSLIAAVGGRHRVRGTGGSSVQPYADSIVLTVDPTVVVTHATSPVVVVVYDQYGSPMANQSLTITSSDPLIGTVQTDDDTGVVTVLGASAGAATITAALTNSRGTLITSNTSPVTVAAQIPTTVVIDPPTWSIADNGSIDLSVVVYDQAPTPFPIANDGGTWTRTGTKATIDAATGVVTGAGTGAGSVTAIYTAGQAVGSAVGSVTAATSVVTTVTVAPSSTTGQVGGVVQLTATLRDQYGVTMPLEGVTWSSGAPLRVTVDASGLATVVGIGAATITATSVSDPSKTGTCTVTGVTPNFTDPQSGDVVVLDMTAGGAQDLQNIADITAFKNAWPDRLLAGGTGTPPWKLVTLDDGTKVIQFSQNGFATATLQQDVTASGIAQTVLVSSTAQMNNNKRMGFSWNAATQTATEAPIVTKLSSTTISATFTQNHSAGSVIAVGFDGGGGSIITGITAFPSIGQREFFIQFDLYMGALAIDSTTTRRGNVGSNYSSFNRSIGQTFNFDMTKTVGAGRKFGTCTKNRQDQTPNRVGDYWDGGPSAATGGWLQSRNETDTLWSKGRGADYGVANSPSATQVTPLNPDSITFQWVRVTKHFRSESSFLAGDGAAAVYIDTFDGNGPRLWYGSEACTCGAESWLNLQLWATWNSPLYPTTDYMKGFKMWYRPWALTIPPGKPSSMTKISDVAGSVTVSVNLPSSNCTAIRFYAAAGGTNSANVPQNQAASGGYFTQIGSDIAVAPSDLGTAKQYVVPVTAGATTLVSHSLGNSGAFGEPSTPIVETNPVVSTPPNAPTAANATSATGNSATFPVTLSASGGAPSAIVPEFDTTGSGNWVAQADVPVTVAQGQAQSVTVTGLTGATTYTNRFRFSAKNVAGTSSASSTVSATTTGQALNVTGGDITLINTGHVLLDITDGTNQVSGCTITPTDTSKCDVFSGYTLVGKADSGSTTVTVSKVGYTDAVITVTCSGLDARWTTATGTSTTTNGAANATWTDTEGSVALTNATGANQPLYTAGSDPLALNGQPCLRFDGTNDEYATAATVAALDGSPQSVFLVVRPSAAGDSRSSSRQIINSINAGALRGFNLSLNSTNKLTASLGTGSAFSPITTTASYTGGAGRYITFLLTSTQQTLRVNGALAATGSVSWLPNLTSVLRLATGSSGGSNFFPGDYYVVAASARLWTGSEYAQLELMAQNVYGL